MSSAILYVTIVAIWACVLIPRWLRRDSARGAADTAGEAVPGDAVLDDDAGDTADSDDGGRAAGAAGAERPGPVRAGPVRAGPVRATRAVEVAAAAVEDVAEAEDPADEAPAPLTSQESRQRMLAARRRLLGMLLVLETAAIALAMLGLAALWVVIPPSVMLAGYMLLLREAAHADRERAAREQEAASARDLARERARARVRAAATAPAPAPAAVPAAPAAGYEEAGPGRDFAPGLAGKYTTSNADIVDTSGEQTGERYLRAVGD